MKDQLVHNTHRDRNVSETVDAAMQEWQRGGSFMGGVAGSYGGAGYGISGALGGGYSTSSGDQSVHAATVQQISDAFAQASASVRELRNTIVVQSDQQEHVTGQTRVVANHNHSHALTMLYYEVLRHYKVTTQFMRVRPVHTGAIRAYRFPEPGQHPARHPDLGECADGATLCRVFRRGPETPVPENRV